MNNLYNNLYAQNNNNLKTSPSSLYNPLLGASTITSSLRLDDIAKMKEAKKAKELEIYKSIYVMVENTIRVNVNAGNNSCYFKIPPFLVGYPTINMDKTSEYIIGLLNHNQFFAERLGPNTIYISWENYDKVYNQKKNIKNNINKEINN